MSSDGSHVTSDTDERLETLSYEECLRLLATKDVGHLAVMIGYYPQVFTVNYRLDDFVVVFRTHAGTKLSAAHHHNVGFHVDHVDPVTRTGWSVLVQGMAESVSSREGDAATERAHALGVEPWAGGDRDELVRIIPAHVTGRRLERAQVVWPDSDIGYL
ncbi:pyridoxamine 5'-phosphate oxidase family protein [Acidiferrimicrobium sp. IK]|uniref:pyridoxamine 5'-phosphate oxidase family protein n=1 Tax=Acidiferrimicrobium sp. IK TaxID=2871700 RepID=UPI0021CB166E|nr:pyridoxamine 5'-phosphate oxidase family protein [Acidiferrimicrobium sp. IK]MCU4182867.1 pyridoxamine 5'-phosphate oxidase family protein [Acidiferrimicrobium sp. IK]